MVRIAGMETYFFMMAIHYPMTTPIELYLALHVITGASSTSHSSPILLLKCALASTIGTIGSYECEKGYTYVHS